MKVSHTLIRRMSQLAFLALALYLTYFMYQNAMGACWLDPFWHIQDLVATKGSGFSTYVGLEKVDLLDEHATVPAISPYVFVGLFVLLVLVLGRLFCGWICPYGTLLEALEGISPFKGKYRMPDELKDKNIKVVVLIGFLVISLFAGYTTFCDYCPAGVVLKGGAWHAVYTAVPVFLIVTLLVFFYGRKAWCLYLCPLGGFMSLLTKYHILPIRPAGECIKCQNCSKNCPMDVLVAEDYIQKGRKITDGECIKCMNCVDACPKKILRFP